jgi:hypothetical protein
MGGSSAPKPPDPVATASAQQGLNLGTAVTQQALNNVNQYTPYGNLTYQQSGNFTMTDPLTGKPVTVPQWSSTQTLAPQQQRLLDSQTQAGITGSNLANQQLGRLGGILGKTVDLKKAPKVGMPQVQTIGGTPQLDASIASAGGIHRNIDDAGKIGNQISDAGRIANRFGSAGQLTRTYGDDAGYAQQRQKVEDTLMARMNPSLNQERDRLTSQLANQGIKQGTEAYDRAMANYGQQTNDARYGAILNAGQEQSRLAGLDQNRAMFENSAQGQAYEQALGRGNFANNAQGQRFGQNQAQAQFGNQAQAQQFGQNAAREAFMNAAQNQQFGQNAQQATFGNDAMQQRFANTVAGRGFNNQANQQTFQNQQGQRANWLNEQYARQNQPINQITALLGTGQVQNPNFQPQGNNQVANTDYAGMVGQNYNQQMAGWQQQQQNNPMNGILGGLFGLGNSFIMGR